MKNSTILALSTLLIAQIVLLFTLYFNQQLITQPPTESLIGEFNLQDIQRIELKANKNTDDEATEFTLKKVNQNWRIETKPHTVLADNTVINDLLEKLKKLKPSLPVASSEDSQKRLEVAKNKYQRLLTFHTSNQSLDLYLGTSPSYQETHARVSNSPNIYTIKLNTFDASDNINDWIKLSQLALKSITRIETNAFAMQRQSSKTWKISKIKANEVANKENANKLAQAFKDLRIEELATQPLPAKVTRINIRTEKQSWTYRMAKVKDRYLIQRNNEAIFTLGESHFKNLSLQPIFIKSSKN